MSSWHACSNGKIRGAVIAPVQDFVPVQPEFSSMAARSTQRRLELLARTHTISLSTLPDGDSAATRIQEGLATDTPM